MLRRLRFCLPMLALALSLSSAMAFADDECNPNLKDSVQVFDAATLNTVAGRQQLAHDRACGIRAQVVNAFNLTKFTMLYNFAGQPDGKTPYGIFQDAFGNLYGTTTLGGKYNKGAVFEISPASSGGVTESVLYSFGATSTDGTNPRAALVQDAFGNFYSTTWGGGTSSLGTVFELSPGIGGAWNESILFDGSGHSMTTPVFDSVGNLYGVGYQGTATNIQTSVFELSPVSGGTWNFSTLSTFPGFAENYGILARDGAGNLYGAAIEGANLTKGGCGWIFKVDAQGNYTDLYDFGSPGDVLADCGPSGAPVLDAYGNLYGTTQGSAIGTGFSGTVWKLSPAPAGGVCPSGTNTGHGWCETVLYVFQGASDGAYPYAGVVSGCCRQSLWHDADRRKCYRQRGLRSVVRAQPERHGAYGPA